jgi:hypothetical protein
MSHQDLQPLPSGATNVAITFPDCAWDLENFEVTFVGPGLARVDEVPFLTELVSFHDIMRVRTLPDGRMEFVEVVQHSNWRTFCFGSSAKVLGTGALIAYRQQCLDADCHCEIVMGGLLLIAVPPDSEWDAEANYRRAMYQCSAEMRVATQSLPTQTRTEAVPLPAWKRLVASGRRWLRRFRDRLLNKVAP